MTQEQLTSYVADINGILANNILVVLLIAVGLYFTIRTGFVQIRCFGEGMKKVFGNLSLHGGKNKSGLSSFQALATAIAAQVGTGNIVGAAGAILTGGPGAIFWMWIIAFLGMATIYAEATLAQHTRKVDEDGTVHGGPVYYIKKAFPNGFGTFLAVFFAISITLALGFMGSMVQSNSIAGAIDTVIKSPALFTFGGVEITWTAVVVGAVVALVAAFIFLGGIQRIASVTEKLVPVMAVLFLAGGVVIIACRIQYIPETIALIFKSAFNAKAILGGGIWGAISIAITQGAKRGLFSNEAGMGSTPHAHAMANVKHPHDQGVVAMIGVFIDTFVVLTMTALVIISSLYTGNGILANTIGNPEAYIAATTGAEAVVSKGDAMQQAFTSTLPALGNFGDIFVAVCLLFFAFSTILSWNFFGKINVQYLFGKNAKAEKVATVIYSVVAIAFIFLGSLLKNDLVWELTDFFNYLMVIPNAIALIALSNLVVKTSKEGIAAKKAAKKNDK